MAIVTDPDNLDRKQVIYGTDDELISLYPVGALSDASAVGVNGVTVNGTKTFTSAGATFQAWNIDPGDILLILNGTDAGHYVIDTIDSETQLTLIHTTTFSPGDTGQEYEVRDPSGGSITDGLTEQALYSFSKEEWKTDSETYGSDDLIRHEFPLLAITPNQFELGGGTTYGTWDFFDAYSRKKIRHGGWEHIDVGGTTIDIYTGMVSLGAMNAAAQAYYQNTDVTTDPINFTFLGAINEAVFVWDVGDDFTTYFKAFLRQKYRSYSSYDLLVEQNLSAIDNNRYQFPLTHILDPAIATWDAEMEGNSPWTNTNVLSSDTDGYTTVSTLTFEDDDATFQADGVASGDVVYIAGGSDAGYYVVDTVVSETEITVLADSDDSFALFAGDTGLTYEVRTKNIMTGIADGALADVDGDTGTFISATGGFDAAGIATGDMLIITETVSTHRGIYKIVSKTNDTTLVINTEDRPFTTIGSIDAYITEPQMAFQYKWDDITISATTTLAFADADPDTITRGGGSWVSDGIEVGDVITISGSTNNDGNYTVADVTSATVLTLVATDTLTTEGAGAFTATCKRGFARILNNVVYAFQWRLFGNGGDLSECYEFHQFQMRFTTDVDHGASVNRGDITDLMLVYVAPNATTSNMVIDDLDAADANNITYIDATGVARTEKFIAAGNITFNDNLVTDGAAIFHMFFLNNDAGDDDGKDFGTPEAITVQDNAASPISGSISGGSQAFSYDYDNNIQRGSGSEGSDADVVVVCIGLTKATYVRTDATIERIKTNTIPCVAPFERNYAT